MINWAKGLSISLLAMAMHHGVIAQEGCCPPAFDNFFMGINAGFASYHNKRADLDRFFLNIETPEHRNTSWAAGIQIGYDYFFCNALVGVVVDWDWTNAKTKVVYHPNNPDLDQRIEGHLRWFSTIRARGGLSLWDVLFYMTGGAAVSDLKSELFNGNFSQPKHLIQKHRWGWTVGVGSEFRIWCHWTLDAEILYLRFNTEKMSFLADKNSYSFRFSDDAWACKLCLNYRFSL